MYILTIAFCILGIRILKHQRMILEDCVYFISAPCMCLVAFVSLKQFFAIAVRHVQDVDNLVLFNAMTIVYYVLMMFLVWTHQNRKWFLDRDGVTYRPKIGRERRLLWTEVERLKWLEKCAVLFGRGRSILIFWNLPRELAEEARKRITDALGRDFDLSPEPRPYAIPPLKDWTLGIGTLSKIIGVGHFALLSINYIIVLTSITLWFWYRLCLAFRWDFKSSLDNFIMFWLVLVLYPPVLSWGFLYRRKRRRFNPSWPWRERIS